MRAVRCRRRSEQPEVGHLSSAFGLVCSKIDINSRHRRGKSGHLKRAAEVALRAGEALVPRLTALITASDRARQEQESWGTWKHVGAV
jgi:hypothetical protein